MLRRLVKTAGFVTSVCERFVFKPRSRRITKEDAVWLRQRLQDMGPTYIKIGQFVSARRDIFDAGIVDEFRRLQDDVPPIPAERVRAILKARFGGSRRRSSGGALSFDERPIASASMGQVHVGRLGRLKVVAKIRRPGVMREIEEEVALLKAALDVMQLAGVSHVAESREVLEGFCEFVMLEGDFANEVRNMRLFARTLRAADVQNVVVPKIVPRLCSEDAIVMEYVPSVKFKDALSRLSMPRRSALAYSLMGTFVKLLLEHGVVHGDPHEGNIALTPDCEKFVFYDFGNVIQVDKSTRQQLKCVVFELITNNVDATVELLRDMDYVSVRDEPSLRAYISMYSQYMRTVDVGVFSGVGKSENPAKLPIKFDAVIFRIIRVFGLVEGICKRLDPSFNYNDVFGIASGLFDSQFIEYKIHYDTRRLLSTVIAGLPGIKK